MFSKAEAELLSGVIAIHCSISDRLFWTHLHTRVGPHICWVEFTSLFIYKKLWYQINNNNNDGGSGDDDVGVGDKHPNHYHCLFCP